MKRVFLLVFCCVLFVPVIASAVERPPDGTVRVYRDSLCKTGPQSTFASTLTGSADGKYPSLVNFPQHDENGSQIPGSTWNDQISCLTIGGGIKEVVIYENVNFKGKSKTLKRKDGWVWSFGGDWWNDRISSFKIIAQ
ncbi:MAG TPA: hypothetical protein P5308_01395 [Syntrophales bacterium]|nr:hypothetical protein [Syntrophales bacterium]